MARDMSYRKPVPIYIPSPPASPIEDLSTVQLLRSSPAIEELAPPLPVNWRETIVQKTSPHVHHLHGVNDFNLVTSTGSLQSQPFEIEGGLEPLLNGEVVPPAIQGLRTSSRASQRQVRSIHQHYRPPTPPLPKSPSRSSSEMTHRDFSNKITKYPASSMRTASSLTMRTFTLPFSPDSAYLSTQASQSPTLRSLTFTNLADFKNCGSGMHNGSRSAPMLVSPSTGSYLGWRHTARSWATFVRSRVKSLFSAVNCHPTA